jgi:hypothetical protein
MKSKKAQSLGLFCVCADELRADEVEPIFQYAQDGPQIVPTLHDQPAGGDDAVSALLSRQANVFFDTVERVLARLAIDGENRLVSQEIDRIIAPRPRRDLAAVKVKNGGEFMSVEGSATSRLPAAVRSWSCQIARRSRAEAYRVGGFAQTGSSIAVRQRSRQHVRKARPRGPAPRLS